MRTDGCASCACAVFAFETALIAPRSSHHTRTAHIPPHSSLRAHRTWVRLLVCIVNGVRASLMLCVRTSLAATFSPSFHNSNHPVFVNWFHPIWSAGGSGLRSVIVILAQLISTIFTFWPIPFPHPLEINRKGRWPVDWALLAKIFRLFRLQPRHFSFSFGRSLPLPHLTLIINIITLTSSLANCKFICTARVQELKHKSGSHLQRDRHQEG